MLDDKIGIPISVQAVSKISDSEMSTLETANSFLESYEKKMGRARLLIKGLVIGPINAFVFYGSPGIGKSFITEEELSSYEESHGIQYQMIRGHITPLQLYETLSNNCSAQSVLVFDDADDVFQNNQSLNVLKAAAETRKVRRICWESRAASTPSFFYEGKIIILTNTNMRSPHFDAMTDRFHKYDPCITIEEKLHKIRTIATNIQDLPVDIGLKVVDFLFKRKETLKKLTLRTFVKMAELAISLPDDWEDMCEFTVLKEE